jgi:hypothetical protein
MIIIKPRFLKRRLGRQFLAAIVGPPLTGAEHILHSGIYCSLCLFVCRWKLSGQVVVAATAEVPIWARRRFPGVVCSYRELQPWNKGVPVSQ